MVIYIINNITKFKHAHIDTSIHFIIQIRYNKKELNERNEK